MTEKQQEVSRLARSLMKQHGVDGSYVFAFDRARRRRGQCRYATPGRTGVISLSVHFVECNSIERIRLTLLHEIAHAIVGPSHGHDHVWRRKCLEIGGDGKRCSAADMPAGEWAGSCSLCRRCYSRFRKPKPGRTYFCTSCGPRSLVNWTRGSSSRSIAP